MIRFVRFLLLFTLFLSVQNTAFAQKSLQQKAPPTTTSVFTHLDNFQTKTTKNVYLQAPTTIHTTPQTNTTGPIKTAVVLFNFQNNQSQPYTIDDARKWTFTFPYSVNGFYREASTNQITLVGKNRVDGDVYGWVTVPYTDANCSENFFTWIASANTILQSQGNDLTGYDIFVYAIPYTINCSFTGLASGNISIINGTYETFVVGHEVGHMLGTGHARSLTCTDAEGHPATIGPFCTWFEYGDPFDIMGMNPRHFSARTKQLFGWISGNNATTIQQSGNYTLFPQEFAPGGIQSLRIPKKVEYNEFGELVTARDESYYYLSYRRPFGIFDAFDPNAPVVNGVSLHLDKNEAGKPFYLLDASPAQADFYNSSLQIGQIFSDIPAGVFITTTQANSAQAGVHIVYTPPLTPTLNATEQCTQTPQGIQLTWSGGPPGTTYIERCEGYGCVNFTQIGSSSGANYFDANVLFNTIYLYRVRTKTNNNVMGAYSFPVSTSFTCTPPQIVLSKINQCEVTTASVNWTAHPQATLYEVWKCTDTSGNCTNFAKVASVPTKIRSYTQKLSTSQPVVYRFKVRAIYEDQSVSDFSNIQSLSYNYCDPGIPEDQ